MWVGSSTVDPDSREKKTVAISQGTTAKIDNFRRQNHRVGQNSLMIKYPDDIMTSIRQYNTVFIIARLRQKEYILGAGAPVYSKELSFKEAREDEKQCNQRFHHRIK